MSQVLSSPVIRILPEQLANQIAAGEVVERPASVIKELIENSLDAGATQIEIDVEEGGIRKIRVRDNGCGIPASQLALAICRHATSKIETAADLQAIDSLGFRGEALASIGSVSRLQLISRIASEDTGWCLSSRNGVDNRIEPMAHPVGTSLEVSDLFYNTPARKKFLRADRTEFRHLDEVFRRMAMGRFDVGFQLKHNHRVVHQLRPAEDSSGQQRRLQQLFGKAFVQQSSQLDMQASGLRLWGWLSKPDYSRSQADQQYFYVNGRIIRDRIINHAIRQAYEPELYPGRQAAYVLHLELDESLVDVNVHPTKHEVRFRESRLVHDFIYKVITDALAHAKTASEHVVIRKEVRPPFVFARKVDIPAAQHIAETSPAYRTLTETHAFNRQQTPLGVWLAELQQRFWLFQNEQGLVLLDLLVARERIFYQRLLDAELPLQRQPVLVPIKLSLSLPQLQWVENNDAQLQQWGMDIRVAGPHTVMVFHIPAMLRGVDVEKFITALLEACLATPGLKSMQKNFALQAARHFRPEGNSDNRNEWLAEVLKLDASTSPVMRIISGERLAELIQRG